MRFCTHSRSASFMCSESRIAGPATFTTVASSLIMNSPDETAASVRHFCSPVLPAAR